MKIKLKLIIYIFLNSYLFGSGAYDQGTSAGKGNLDISLTWNPFNYFEQGQSYIVFGYGLTDRLDIHGYYSKTKHNNDNYYGGILYQFYNSKYLDISTAFGVRQYINNNKIHLFFPQLLYTIKATEKIELGGTFVEIRNKDLKSSNGIATDLFLMYKVYENNKYKINISIGGFNPVLWEPHSGEWYPTYSLDIKIK